MVVAETLWWHNVVNRGLSKVKCYIYSMNINNYYSMKKLFYSLALYAIMTLSMVACESKEDADPDKPNNPNNYTSDSNLTPGEHKAKLEDIALEFADSFNVSDVEDAVNALCNLSDYLEYGDFPDYYSNMINDIVNGVTDMSTANFMSFATRASENFIIDINDPDTNPYAGYSYTYDDYEWVKKKTNDKSVKLIWDNAEATLAWDNTKKFEYEFDDVDYTVYVPKTITFKLNIASREHIKAVVSTNITDVKTLAPTVEVKLNGGYVLNTSNSANSKGVESHSTIKKNGKALMSAASVVAINDATDIDSWLEEYYCEYCEENHYDFVSPEYFGNNLKTGSAQIDILSLSIVASGDFKGMYDKYDDLEDKYDDDSKKFYEEVCKLINNSITVIVAYNDTQEKVADIVAQVAYYDDYYGVEYYIEPILLFPDGSKYAFEDYFTERAFGDLLDKLEGIAGEIENLE